MILLQKSNYKQMSEIQIQAKCFQWLWNTHSATRRCFFAVPNQGTRSAVTTLQLKASGLVPGIPDCILVWKGRAYGFEFKTDTGVLSVAQQLVHTAWSGHAEVFVVRSFEEFRVIVEKILN
jgi:hypothetical protein